MLGLRLRTNNRHRDSVLERATSVCLRACVSAYFQTDDLNRGISTTLALINVGMVDLPFSSVCDEVGLALAGACPLWPPLRNY